MPSTAAHRAAFSFSIRSLLVATAAVAAAVGAVTTEPSWQSCLALEGLSLWFSTAGITAALNSRGPKKSFWICAAVPTTVVAGTFVLVVLEDHLDSFDDLEQAAKWMRVTFPIVWGFSFASGIIGAVAY
jgi:hypothetical protein